MKTCKLLVLGVVLCLSACVRKVEVVKVHYVPDIRCLAELDATKFDNYLLKDYAADLEAKNKKLATAQKESNVQKSKSKAGK